jgi:multiple antibiotic resistance protein|tara:strand:- start:41 stop:634 length:594 start_codon:yes stop_codon:yes gene_type:complete
MEFILNVLTVFLTLFAVIDMPGNVPLIIKLRKENGEIESLKSTIIATVIMISILFVGQTLFRLLGIETFHFALAGAMLLLYFGVKMVLGIESESTSEPMSATIFPIAFPIIAGPGTLSTIMSLTQDLSNIEIILGIILNAIMIYVFLKTAPWIQGKLGKVGITIMERVFGILLVAIGMKILINSLVLSVVAAQAAIG